MSAFVRSTLALAAAVVMVASAGSKPASAAGGSQQSGIANVQFTQLNGFADATEDGVAGRNVQVYASHPARLDLTAESR